MGVIVKNTILEDVLACHNKGLNNQEIANNFGISSVKVRKLLITAGITFTSKTYELVTAMHKRGYSAAEIAAKCNLSIATVIAYLPYSRCIYDLEDVSTDCLYKRVWRQAKK